MYLSSGFIICLYKVRKLTLFPPRSSSLIPVNCACKKHLANWFEFAIMVSVLHWSRTVFLPVHSLSSFDISPASCLSPSRPPGSCLVIEIQFLELPCGVLGLGIALPLLLWHHQSLTKTDQLGFHNNKATRHYRPSAPGQGFILEVGWACLILLLLIVWQLIDYLD